MKNDRERRAFVEDKKNWEPIGETHGIRLTELSYKGRSWYRIEIWQNHVTGYDFENHKQKWGRAWIPVHIYKLDETSHAYTSSVSPTEVAREIKEMDKEDKTK